MNLSLHDPLVITADYPSTLTTSLSYGHCTRLSVSPCGHYIASGLADGLIIIVDAWTHNISSILRGHSRAILGIRWLYSDDKNDTGLISWGKDWKVIQWKLNKQNQFDLKHEYKFTGGVIKVTALINSQGHWRLIVARNVDGLCLVENNEIKELNSDSVITSDGSPQCISSTCNDMYIIVGTSKGWVQIIEVESFNIIKRFKVCPGSIKGIEIVEQAFYDVENGKVLYGSENCLSSKMIVNSNDRILRQYNISEWNLKNNIDNWEIELEQKYQDVVNQVQWNSIKIGATGEYICASTQSQGGASHDIYVWETSMGSLVQILEGPQEELMDVDWCGRRCEIIASGTDTGTIYVWGIQVDPKWSALAPDFEEIEQNINYEEKEDEFDFLGESDDEINQNDEMKVDGHIIDEEDVFVDVLKKEKKDARGFNIINGIRIDVELNV